MQAKVQYPKLLINFLIYSLLIHLDNHSIKGYLLQSLQVGMFYIIDSFAGLGVNIGSFVQA